MTTPRPLLGVSTCLFRGPDVLLVRRARAPFAGLYSLPGGKVEFGETLLAAAHRELREETAIAPCDLRFHQLHEAIDPDRSVHVVIAVFRGWVDPSDPCEPAAGDDAAEACFVTSDELAALGRHGATTDGLLPIVSAARDAVHAER